MVSSTVSPVLSRAPSSSSSQLDPELEEAVVKEFLELLHTDEPSEDSISMPVAGVKVLIGVIRRSKAATVMGMERELRQTADALLNSVKLHSKSTIALSSGCELFLRYVTRCSLDFPDFDDCKLQVLQRGEKFAEMSVTSRLRIAELGHGFVRDGAVVMTHGYSRVVTSLLVRAAKVNIF
jgi:translation initiation factor eIF-2B subunit alpha